MNIYLELILVVFGYFLLFYIIGLIKKDNSFVDIGWGLGFIVITLYSLLSVQATPVDYIIFFMVSIWGLRLTWHISDRKLGAPEDFRYQKWREEWNYFYIRSFLQIYMLQGILLYIIAYPAVKLIISPETNIGWVGFLGICIWIIGFAFEVIADWQLKKFLQNRNDENKIMDSGLWKYSRHPNYFGESVVWIGVFLLTFDVTGSLLTVVSPISITLLIRFVSGVPLLEKRFENNARYQKYAKQTNIFFPWFSN
ncbi:MAG: DUF1295 domain-containing protein [Nanoarchaeota archaeon]